MDEQMGDAPETGARSEPPTDLEGSSRQAARKPMPTPAMTPSQVTRSKVTSSPLSAPAPGAASDFGYVAEDGAAFVKLPDGNEQQVGQWTTTDAAGNLDIKAAIAFYASKYNALVTEIDLAAARLAEGKSDPKDARAVAEKVREATLNPSFIGDLTALAARIGQLEVLIEVREEVIGQERAEFREKILKEREELADQAEALADSQSYKKTFEQYQVIIEKWKTLPRFDRHREDELWKRISKSRNSFDKRRRAYFAELDVKRSEAKATKEAIIKRAALLSGSRDWVKTSGDFRKLLDEWKAAGRAGKADDKLWEKFKAEQDKFYDARKSVYAERDKEELDALAVKEKLAAQAEALLPITNIGNARNQLRQIQDQWEKAGRVPKNNVRQIEGRLEKVEKEIRAFGQSKVDPKKRGRALDTLDQFQQAVDKYTRQLQRAEADGNTKAAAEAAASLANAKTFLAAAAANLEEVENAK